jgi:hypothetical protein
VGVGFTNAAGAPQQIAAGTLFVILSSVGGGGGPGPAPAEGLSYYGVVDAVPGANQFTIGALAGLGAGKFAGATNPFMAFVIRDAGGASAAPQGEQQAITAYVTATGVFTTAAFTAAVAVGDEILLLHPDVAGIIMILANLAVPGPNVVTNILERDVIGNKTDNAVQTKAAVNSIVAYLKGLLDVLNGADGITVFPASSPPANLVSMAEVLRYVNDLVVAAFTLQETGGTLLADGTEQNIVINDAPASVFIPSICMIDLTNMAAGDATTIRVYYRIAAGGALILHDTVAYAGAISPPLINIDLKPNRFGFKVTLEQTDGTLPGLTHMRADDVQRKII